MKTAEWRAVRIVCKYQTARISGRINSRLIIFRIIRREHRQPSLVPLAIQTIIWALCFSRLRAGWKWHRDAPGVSVAVCIAWRLLSLSLALSCLSVQSFDDSYLKYIQRRLHETARMNATEGGIFGDRESRGTRTRKTGVPVFNRSGFGSLDRPRVCWFCCSLQFYAHTRDTSIWHRALFIIHSIFLHFWEIQSLLSLDVLKVCILSHIFSYNLFYR